MADQNELCEERDAGQSYAVCYRCRKRKIRCTRERPSCSNCTSGGYECEWSEKGKKPNQAFILSTTISELNTRLARLETTVASIAHIVERLSTTTTTTAAAATATPIFPPSPLSLSLADPFAAGGGGGGSRTPPNSDAAVTPPFRHQSDAAAATMDMDYLAAAHQQQHFQFYHSQVQDEHGHPTSSCSQTDASPYPVSTTFSHLATFGNSVGCIPAYHGAWGGDGAKPYTSSTGDADAEIILTEARAAFNQSA